jgi:D-alanine-D-alanine ligase
MTKKAIILINKLSDNPTTDELDVLEQARVVQDALTEIGYAVSRAFFDLNMQRMRDLLVALKPDIAFNLVEGVEGKAELIYFPTALLESLNIPYSGCRLDSMYLTSNKVYAKEKMRANGLPTADWFSAKEVDKLSPDKLYIIKPLWEDASVGIDEHRVLRGNDPKMIEFAKEPDGHNYFIEEYIKGREFNMSVLGGLAGPEVMNPAEMLFHNFPEGKPQIMGYRSKWVEGSFEYENTSRTFEIKEEDIPMHDQIRDICRKCWQVFNLKGYARVDLRVTEEDRPLILEINANPCISPDAGFYVACSQAGHKFTDVIKRIIEDAYTN